MNKPSLALAAALSLASSAYAEEKAKKPAAPAKDDPSGLCFGVVAKDQGDCGGKDPATGATWGCMGQAPSSDLAWKRMTKSECDKAPKHKDAKAKKFEPSKA